MVRRSQYFISHANSQRSLVTRYRLDRVHPSNLSLIRLWFNPEDSLISNSDRSSTTHLRLVDLKQPNMLHLSKMFVDFTETEPKSNTVYLLYLKILEIPGEGLGERKLP